MRAHVRHILSLLAGVAMLCAFTLVGAAPAQAVVGVDLSVDDATINVGGSATLTWTSTDAVTLVASDDWTGDRAIPNGSESVTPPGVGTFTYTLTATDAGQNTSTEAVTVTVVNAPITPAPVTFDGCVVTVPATPNVTYFADFNGLSMQLAAGTYGGFETDEVIVFYAVAGDGFSFADDAITSWEYPQPAECIGDELVTVTATCDTVTFTNISGVDLTVQWGSFDEDQPDGEFDLDDGAAHTIQTDRDHVDFEADAGDGDDRGQGGGIDLPTCDGDPSDGSDHPTVAPAAGASR